MTDYVARTWPDEIMLDTYGPGGSLVYGAVEKQLGPLTAARLGLCTTFDGAEQFPAVLETPAGTFSTGELAGSVGLPDGMVGRQTRLTPGTTTGTTKGRCAHAHGTGLSAAGGAGARRRL